MMRPVMHTDTLLLTESLKAELVIAKIRIGVNTAFLAGTLVAGIATGIGAHDQP